MKRLNVKGIKKWITIIDHPMNSCKIIIPDLELLLTDNQLKKVNEFISEYYSAFSDSDSRANNLISKIGCYLDDQNNLGKLVPYYARNFLITRRLTSQFIDDSWYLNWNYIVNLENTLRSLEKNYVMSKVFCSKSSSQDSIDGCLRAKSERDEFFSRYFKTMSIIANPQQLYEEK